MATNQSLTKRIGYIDALRGFTMILVVCSHVAYLSHIGDNSYSRFFLLFRMPLFFFISGFILYKDEHIWNITNSIRFLSKKFLVQIIPTAIFLSIYMFVFSLPIDTFNGTYYGYWFTVTLFEFFVVYILCNMLIRSKLFCYALLLIGAIALYVYSYSPQCHDYPSLNSYFIAHFQYFIFFIIGTLAKRYFDKLKCVFNSNIVMLLIISLMMIGIILYVNKYFCYTTVKLSLSILSIFAIFYFFMKNGNFLDNSHIGRSLQFIGRRTLDIYLLHYFFVYDSISWIKDSGISSPTIILVISIITSVIIIGICLLVSNFLRTNPLLGKILFGAKPTPATQ